VRAYEAFKRDPANAELPDLPFQYFTSLTLDRAQ